MKFNKETITAIASSLISNFKKASDFDNNFHD